MTLDGARADEPLAGDLAAGTYTVGIMEKTTGSPASTTNGSDVRVVALALGG